MTESRIYNREGVPPGIVESRIYLREGVPPGPWDSEPDRISWTDKDTGYPALMKRNEMGTWCGYVAVLPGHPAHGRGCDKIDAHAHGGLNYSNKCNGDPGIGICHVPAEGEPGDVWWFGFDCGHADDWNWTMERIMGSGPGWDGWVYRDREYVEREIAKLAEQLHDQQNSD